MILNLKDLEINNYVSWVYSTFMSKFTAYEGAGQLGSPKIVAVTNEDIDTYLTAGVYCFAQGYAPINRPAENTNGWLVVIPWQANGSTCKQIWLRHGTPANTDHSIYIRTRISGTWGTWYEVITSKAQSVYQLNTPLVQLNTGVNLNNYKTVGSYYCTGTSTATTILNSPTVYNYKLVVEQVTPAFIQQTVMDRLGGRWVRLYTISLDTWSDWVGASFSNIFDMRMNSNAQLEVTTVDGKKATFDFSSIIA